MGIWRFQLQSLKINIVPRILNLPQYLQIFLLRKNLIRNFITSQIPGYFSPKGNSLNIHYYTTFIFNSQNIFNSLNYLLQIYFKEALTRQSSFSTAVGYQTFFYFLDFFT